MRSRFRAQGAERRAQGLGIGVAVLLAALLLAPSADARRSVPQGFVGMNWDGHGSASDSPAVQGRALGQMASAGAESVRVAFSWAAAQPEENGPFNFTRTDAVVAAGSTRGVSILPVVILAPKWARQGQTDQYPFTPPIDDQRYAAYLTALIGRYGPHGSFWDENPSLPRRPIRAWQIWNEPHLQYQWTIPEGQDWAPGYRDLLMAAHAAVKQADPGAQVVLGGLSNDSWHYLQRLYIDGAGDYFDVAAIHPYTRTPAGVVELVRRFRVVMRRYGDASKPVWVTELGLPASKGRSSSKSPLQTSDTGMARFLRDSFRQLAKARSRPGRRVARAYWYSWSTPYSGRDIFGYSGLFRQRGSGNPVARLAHRVFVRVARELEGCRKNSRGRCR